MIFMFGIAIKKKKKKAFRNAEIYFIIFYAIALLTLPSLPEETLKRFSFLFVHKERQTPEFIKIALMIMDDDKQFVSLRGARGEDGQFTSFRRKHRNINSFSGEFHRPSQSSSSFPPFVSSTFFNDFSSFNFNSVSLPATLYL